MENKMNHKHEGGATCESAGCDMKGGCVSGCVCMKGGCMSGCGSFWTSKPVVLVVGIILGLIIAHFLIAEKGEYKRGRMIDKGDYMMGEKKMDDKIMSDKMKDGKMTSGNMEDAMSQ